MLQEAFIIPMNETATESLINLMHVYTFSQSLNISQYLYDLDLAESSLTNDLVQDIIHNLTDKIYNDTAELTSQIEIYFKEDLGQCRSIYNSYSYTTDAVCIDFLYPFNTVWFTTGLCLLLLLLWIPVTFKLASFYSKTDKYAEPFPSFMRMSFHRHNYSRSNQRPRTNHGNDIQAEIAMRRLNDPRYRRSRAPINAIADVTTASTQDLILETMIANEEGNGNAVGYSETDMSKVSESSEETDVSVASKDSEERDIFIHQGYRGQGDAVREYPTSIYPIYNPGEISLNMHPEPMYQYHRQPPRQILTDVEDSGFMNEIYF